jgi:hypothetical protein
MIHSRMKKLKFKYTLETTMNFGNPLDVEEQAFIQKIKIMKGLIDEDPRKGMQKILDSVNERYGSKIFTINWQK